MEWSPDLAYAIGLIATDGCLSIDNRHVDYTSKDRESVETFRKCLQLDNKIGRKTRGNSKIKKYYRVQFGSKNFYEFLLSIGLTPAKSNTLGPLKIDSDYFADFLRGCIDGDGCISVARHPESRHPQLRLRLISASPMFLDWIKSQIGALLHVNGGWIARARRSYVLTYAKSDTVEILWFIYYDGVRSYLNRKYVVAKPFLRMWPNR